MSKSWDERVAEIETRIKSGVEDFLTWPVVVGSMHVGEGGYTLRERRELHRFYDARGMDSNMVHQLYHLWRWHLATELWVEDIGSVVEIGGGYGSMYHLWRHLGFTGEYKMYDYEPVMKLQQHYCQSNGLVPPAPAKPPLAADLLIASHSLSEATLSERQAIMDGASFRHFLVAYAPMWDGVDNEKYFAAWGGERMNHPYFRTGVYRLK